MMFQTSGLNTGRVRLEAAILGFCCAREGAPRNAVSAVAAVIFASRRRDILCIKASSAGVIHLGLTVVSNSTSANSPLTNAERSEAVMGVGDSLPIGRLRS